VWFESWISILKRLARALNQFPSGISSSVNTGVPEFNHHTRDTTLATVVEAGWRDGTRAETTFRLPAKRTSLFKSAGASVQSTTGSRDLRISGSNAGYTTFRGSVKGTVYPRLSSVSPLIPLPCITLCHHISTGVYRKPVAGMHRPRYVLQTSPGSTVIWRFGPSSEEEYLSDNTWLVLGFPEQ